MAEHLDEAAFAVEALVNLQRDPLMTLQDQIVWGESRLETHVDGLVVGGPIVVERTLLPELVEPAADEPERLTAAAMALLSSGCEREALGFTQHDDEAVRRAGALAFRWAGRGIELASQRLSPDLPPAEQAGLLAVCAAGHVPVLHLASYLQGPVPSVVAAAVALALHSPEPASLHTAVDDLLARDEPELVAAALVPGLAWGSRLAYTRLAERTMDNAALDGHLLALHAALFDRVSHAPVVERARGGQGQEAALFALGYSGDIEHTPLLLEVLAADNPRAAALAAQSLALIFGLDLRDDALFHPPKATAEGTTEDSADEDHDGLPPFDEDDLDADLMPLPEAGLDRPNADAFAAAVEHRRARLDPAVRYLRGKPFSALSLVDALAHGTLRTRHVLADLLAVLSAGTHVVDTRAWVARQRKQLNAIGDPTLLPLARNPLVQ